MTEQERLIEEAKRAAQRSHSPYSRFRVGAVAVAVDGTEYRGCNVENAAYGSSICAEANAITTAVASGAEAIDTVAVACLDGDDECAPCGNCRQLMREFGVRRILLVDAHGEPTEYRLSELLPHSFGPDNLRSNHGD